VGRRAKFRLGTDQAGSCMGHLDWAVLSYGSLGEKGAAAPVFSFYPSSLCF
jgi:hypothetical protein